MHQTQGSHRQGTEKEASTPWGQVATGFLGDESAGLRTWASSPLAPDTPVAFPHFWAPLSGDGQAALSGPWSSSHLMGVATSTFLFYVIFSPRVSREHTGDRTV